MARSILCAVLLAALAVAHAQAPTVTADAQSVTLTFFFGQTLSASLDDATVSLRSGFGSCSLHGNFKDGDGWARPSRPEIEPVLEQTPDSARALITYPLVGGREVTLELSAYTGVPAAFVTIRLSRPTAGAEYYYWQSDLGFTRYVAPTPDGLEEITCDTAKWDTVAWRDWWFISGDKGGVAFLPTNVGGRAPGPSSALYLHALPRSQLLGPGDAHTLSFGIGGAPDAAAAADALKAARERDIPALKPWKTAGEPVDYGRPAPQWAREAELYQGYYRNAAQWTDEVVQEKLRHAPFVIGSTPDKAALERCHAAGVRLLHYVVYTCLLDTEMQVREGGQVYSEWSESIDNQTRDLKDHPDWVCIDEKGGIQRDGWGQAHGHPGLLNTCLHQRGLQEAAVRQVRMLMEAGYDGVFIDLAGPTVECYGPQHGKHTHPGPARTNTEAYEELLAKVYEAVKSFGDDRIVVQNTCTGILPGHWAHADMQMLEAYPHGEGSAEPRATWPEMRWVGETHAGAVSHGKLPILLPYIGGVDAASAREAALFGYAYARLYGLLWGDYFTASEVPAARDFAMQLYQTRIGQPVGDRLEQGPVLYREFERGLAVLNPSEWPVTVTIPVPADAEYNDLGHERALSAQDGRITLELAPGTGRILVRKGAMQGAVP